MNFSARGLLFSLPLFIIAAMFVFVSRGYYFSSDDPFMLYNTQNAPHLIDQLLQPVGRWLNALFMKGAFSFVPDIEGLFWIRVANGLFLTFLAFGSALFMHRLGMPHWPTALVISCLAMMTPSSMPILAWAQHISVAFGANLVLAAYALLFWSEQMKTIKRLVFVLFAIILMYLAASINQQLLAFSGVFYFIYIYFSKNFAQVRSRTVFAGAATIGAYFLAVVFVKYLTNAPGDRTALVVDFMGKLSWFVAEPLRNAIFSIAFPRMVGTNADTLNGGFSGIVILALLVALVLLRSGTIGNKVAVALLFPAAILGSYGPVLAAQESWASYRALWPLQTLFAFVIGLLLWTCVHRFTHHRMAYAVLLVFFVANLFGWQSQYQSHIRGPYMLEAQNAQMQISSYLTDVAAGHEDAILVVHPIWLEADRKFVYYDDIGGPTIRPWTVKPLMGLIAQDIGQSLDQDLVELVGFDARESRLADNPLFIDLTSYAGNSQLQP